MKSFEKAKQGRKVLANNSVKLKEDIMNKCYVLLFYLFHILIN